MDTDAYFPDCIAALDRILRQDWFRLVQRSYHRPWSDKDLFVGGLVGDDEEGEVRSIPTRASADEIDERHLQVVRGAKGSVVGLVDRSGAVVVEETIRSLYVAIR